MVPKRMKAALANAKKNRPPPRHKNGTERAIKMSDTIHWPVKAPAMVALATSGNKCRLPKPRCSANATSLAGHAERMKDARTDHYAIRGITSFRRSGACSRFQPKTNGAYRAAQRLVEIRKPWVLMPAS